MLNCRFALSILLTLPLIGGALPAAPAMAQQQAPTPGYIPLGSDDLQRLLAPIALYPDAILAQTLVASTYPQDVIAASQWINAGNSTAGIDDQGWDLSVKGVARWPALLNYMATNIDWTNNVGAAFINQPGDVTGAVQALRGQALAAGTLVSNDKQTVINEDGKIEIIPANPQQVYLPTYNDQTVYAEPDYTGGAVYNPGLIYGDAVEVGPWLCDDVDWFDGAIYAGAWGSDRPWWHHHPGERWDIERERPGLFRGPAGDVRFGGHDYHVAVGRWTPAMHLAGRPFPRFVAHPGDARLPYGRAGAGYPPDARGADMHVPDMHAPGIHAPDIHAAPDAHGPFNYDEGADAGRFSARGEESRRAAAPADAPRPEDRPIAPQPREAPHEEPARPEPDHGGAFSGYGNGDAAAAASARGAESRGGGGFGGGGGGGGREGGFSGGGGGAGGGREGGGGGGGGGGREGGGGGGGGGGHGGGGGGHR